jgi:ABC transporter substrate binding protein (PQQ-dependent alcohol dehydrogenase system)
MLKFALGLSLVLYGLPVAHATDGEALQVRIVYAEQKFERPPVLSNLRQVPDDLGLAGARLSIEDNNAAGRLLKQSFALDEVIAEEGESLADLLKPRLGEGTGFIIVNAPADELLRVVDLAEAKGYLIFNSAERDNVLRAENCRPNVLHTVPSRAMITDALAQFFVKKQWRSWFVIFGKRVNDKAYAESLKVSATKFGIEISGEKEWDSDADMRDSVAEEVPLMTQDGDYDAVIVADENDDFGGLIAMNTWLPRPVAGTHGLVATGWLGVIEPWGAVQLHNRFRKLAGREMREVDFAAFAAVLAIGEAARKTKGADPIAYKSFLTGEDVQISAYKGRGLSFRSWDGQLRQPIHLVTSDAQVAVAPFDGFLHEFNDMDTLGYDVSEGKCTNFQK